MTASIAALPDGTRLAYELREPPDPPQVGAPPILLVRPIGGSMASWQEFGDALASRMRVIAFDARGTGRSQGRVVASTRSMARDAAALLEALGIARAHVYGISLGGMVATWLTIDAPDRVDRLVLASTLPKGMMFGPQAPVRALSFARCLARPTASQTEACLATRVLSHAFRREHPAEVEKIRATATSSPSSRGALLLLGAAALRHDVTARLGDVRAPTLILAGDRDHIVPVAPQRWMLGRIPRARLAMAQTGHDISAEAPRWAAAEVIAHVLDASPTDRR